MIIPEHCREVSLWKVGFKLETNTIKKNLEGKEAYTRTKYIVLNNGRQYAVIELRKTNRRALFNDITSVRIVSLPEETAYIEDPEVDVLSRPLLAERAAESRQGTVVVKGMFEHLSFVHKLKFKEIRVLEVVPPFPPKLTTLARMALRTEDIQTPVRIIEELIDIRNLAGGAKTKEILFACEASNLGVPEKKSLFIDRNPRIEDATLVGCNLTRRVAKHLYKKDLPFIDICPRNLARKTDVPTLVKCCELQTTGFTKDGKLAMVPWGARISDVVGAMKYLLGEG